MNRILLYRVGRGVLLGVMLLLALTLSVASADCTGNDPSDPCSPNFRLHGNLSALSNPLTATLPAITNARLPMAGPLFYDDYKRLEAQARLLLNQNMKFREDLSPYRESKNFNDLVRKFDTISDFAVPYTPHPTIPAIPLQVRIDQADQDLRQARDLYAYLIVYAPEARLRSDSDYITKTIAGFATPLCGRVDREDPNPPDPTNSSQVLDPIIDWCNFAARLRQSVREAAYLRMIFAQQYMVNALSPRFGGANLIGGEDQVRKEVANLEAAKYQFALAQKGLTEALQQPLGSGCLVSDFYTQLEWALLTNAAKGQETAQHHIATRLSYLGIDAAADIPRAQALAQEAFRTGATEGYIKLIGTAGMNAVPQSASRCKGTPPDGSLVAEMTLNLLDTRAKAREMVEGRNIFGYDLRFTPDRPYRNGDAGLWDEAMGFANFALRLQEQTLAAERDFDLNQTKLFDAVLATNNEVDNAIQKEAGCDLQAFDTDAEWYACIDDMIKHTQECDPTYNPKTHPPEKHFEACMSRTTDGLPPKIDESNLLILVSEMRNARRNLRIAWLGVEAAILKRDNLMKRADSERMRRTQVRSAILVGSQTVAAFEAAIVAANCCTVDYSAEGGVSVNYGAYVEAVLGPVQILVEAATELEVLDAESADVIRNFFYDLAEAQGDIDSAVQQYNAALTEFNGVVGQTLHDVYQSRREHAYTTALPANDPSYRMLRDSLRLQLAARLEKAARQAYLAARRAEYEYAASLSHHGFNISDIYKARTVNDIITFLQDLDGTVNNLAGAIPDAQIAAEDLTLAVSTDLLGLTPEYLRAQGVAEVDLESERIQRFRAWVAQNTAVDTNGKPILRFTFSTSPAAQGLLGQIAEGYDAKWLTKVAGIGAPKPTSNGLGVNLQTAQTGNLGYRTVNVSQSGQVAMTSFAGCLFDYRLLPTIVLEGGKFPTTQSTEVVSAIFRGSINGLNGTRHPAFLGRPLAANEWQVEIETGLTSKPDLNLQELTEIELLISTTYASRQPGVPTPSECVRIDF